MDSKLIMKPYMCFFKNKKCLFYAVIIIQILACNIEVIGQEEVNEMQNESYESLVAEHFNFDQWKFPSEGANTRFHVNVDLDSVGKKFCLACCEEYPIYESQKDRLFKSSQYRLIKNGNKDYHLIVEIFECNSILEARKMILSSLAGMSRILRDDETERPNGYTFGDVYKMGYWSRDNIFVSVKDINNTYSEYVKKVIKNVNVAIDEQLIKKPDEHMLNEKGPSIDCLGFSGIKTTSKIADIPITEIQKGSETKLKVLVEKTEIPLEHLTYTFFTPAGQILRKDAYYYYKAEQEGIHTLKLYVKNKETCLASWAMVYVKVL